MKPDPNYPRMMFHRSRGPVTVYSEEQEAALGADWSRTIVSALPVEDKPAKIPHPEREPDPEEEEDEPEQSDPAEPEPEESAPEEHASAHKPKRVRPPGHHKDQKTPAKRKHGG